jgi:tetratricopeptide (TPR) repeat protein
MDYRLDLILDHFGADPDVMREKGKDARNIALLEARLAEKPDDLLTHFYLGSQHWVAGRRQEAADAFERVIELFERNPARYGLAIRHVPVPYSYVGLVRCLCDLNRATEAVEVGHRGLSRWPDHVDLWFHTGLAAAAHQDLAEARRCLERALSSERSGYALIGMHDAGIQEWKAEKILGDIDYEEGDHTAACARYARVVDAIADPAERIAAAARLVELATELGDVAQVPAHTLRYMALRPTELGVALQVAAWLRGRAGLQAAYDLLTALDAQVEALRGQPALAQAVGQIAEEAGEPAEALRWYERVVEAGSTDPQFWASLSRVFLALNQPQAAAEALQVAKRHLAAARPA